MVIHVRAVTQPLLAHKYFHCMKKKNQTIVYLLTQGIIKGGKKPVERSNYNYRVWLCVLLHSPLQIHNSHAACQPNDSPWRITALVSRPNKGNDNKNLPTREEPTGFISFVWSWKCLPFKTCNFINKWQSIYTGVQKLVVLPPFQEQVTSWPFLPQTSQSRE